MASRWYWQVLGEELGPVSWSDLVEMVRAGTLSPTDLIRRDERGAWEPAEKVVGLFRAARRTADSGGEKQSVVAHDAPPAATGALQPPTARRSSQTSTVSASAEAATALLKSLAAEGDNGTSDTDAAPYRDAGRRWPNVLLAVSVVGVMTAGAGWWGLQQSRFPPHRLNASNSGVATPAHLLNAPRPRAPSVPGLPEGVAVPLPGFEGLPNAYSPCLSADLKTIVFARLTNGKTWFDLYIAARDKVEDPFGSPRLLLGCQSAELDAYPALSPNLRELIFVRSEDNPRLMRATRRRVDAEFGPAEVWSASGLDQPGVRSVGPQFVNADTVCFVRQQVAPPNRQLWLARRSKSGEFAVAQILACQNPWAAWVLSAGGVRAYHGTEAGVFVGARQSGSHPFGTEVVWADSAQTGPIDGPIWVAPAEDVIVYCSAGPGKTPFSSRKLWMFRK